MQSILFSVIVPIYEVEQYLERCVETLINQTEKNIEIILVDDGSPDRCPNICDRYEEQDNRVVVIHKENGGLSQARNEGIKRAKGKYIIFVDSDDYIDLDACERIVKFTDRNVDIIVTDGISEGGNVNLIHSGVVNDEIYSGKAFLKNSVMYGRVPMAAWLYVYRRDFLLENELSFKVGIYHEDEEFTPRALLSAGSVVNTGESYYHYIIRQNSIMTQTDKRKHAEDLFKTCKHLCAIYDELDDNELKNHMKDSLVNKYLSIFQEGRLYQYGSHYLHKDFVLTNAYKMRTKLKVWLYCISPVLYWYINRIL